MIKNRMFYRRSFLCYFFSFRKNRSERYWEKKLSFHHKNGLRNSSLERCEVWEIIMISCLQMISWICKYNGKLCCVDNSSK